MTSRTRLSLRLFYVGFKGQRAILHARGGEPGDEAMSYIQPTSSSECAMAVRARVEELHVFLECGSDAQGLDAFVRVSRDLSVFNRPAPVVLEVQNCCIVPVSI